MPPDRLPDDAAPGRGIQRRLTLANLARRRRPARRRRCGPIGLVGRLRPAVVVAVGGYASVAVGPGRRRCGGCRSSWRSRTSCPGAANRLLARFARASAVSFPGTAPAAGRGHRQPDPGRDHRPRPRPRPRRRQASLRRRPRPAARAGVRRARSAPCGSTRPPWRPPTRWRDRADLAVHHVVGRRDWDAIVRAAAADDTGALDRRLVPYEDDMPAALAAADVAVCRSGSSTCFELAAAGPARGAGAVALRHRRPADRQRPAPGRRRRRRARAATPSSTARGWSRRSTRSSPTTPGWRRWPTAARALGPPDAAADIAALAAEHARG